MENSAQLDALSRGFRSKYLGHEEITAQLRAWAEAFPRIVRLRSIGKSAEGRDLWLLTIGPDPDRTRPSMWVDGNMHATEVCGSSVALGIAEDVIRLHLEPEAEFHGLPRHTKERLRDVLFHVMPRMSPDGAESVLTTGRYCRSNPRDARANKPAKWVAKDQDGDGLALSMRKRDPGGEWVESKEVPNLMLARTIEDEGPFFKIWPEGEIEGFTGDVPDPHYLSDNDADLNRNFPHTWAEDHEQIGAGRFPLSEPESRAVVEFVTEHPEIFAWVNYHTFGGVLIRPLGDKPDNKMDPGDRAIFRQIEQWMTDLTGYPTVSGYEEFLYEPDKPLKGDLSDFAYHTRGAISYVVELWDLFAQLGMARKKPFVDLYSSLTRADLVKLGKWDAEKNAGRLLKPWRPMVHPQLGEVEVGGLDPRVGISNPPYEQLAETCTKQAAVTFRVAALAPHVAIERVSQTSLGGDLRRVDVTFANHGYLPSYGPPSAKTLSFAEPLRAEVTTEGCSLVTDLEARREIGHLDGWGRGIQGDEGTIFWLRSRGSTGSKTLRWVVRGKGIMHVRVTSCRTGTVERIVEIA
ncbi:MAG: M14 family metallopeptidase [Polyangiales bacterium]